MDIMVLSEEYATWSSSCCWSKLFHIHRFICGILVTWCYPLEHGEGNGIILWKKILAWQSCCERRHFPKAEGELFNGSRLESRKLFVDKGITAQLLRKKSFLRYSRTFHIQFFVYLSKTACHTDFLLFYSETSCLFWYYIVFNVMKRFSSKP